MSDNPVQQRGNDVQWLVSELTSAARRIEQLERALREIRDWNNNQNSRILKIDAVIGAALAGEKKDE